MDQSLDEDIHQQNMCLSRSQIEIESDHDDHEVIYDEHAISNKGLRSINTGDNSHTNDITSQSSLCYGQHSSSSVTTNSLSNNRSKRSKHLSFTS